MAPPDGPPPGGLRLASALAPCCTGQPAGIPRLPEGPLAAAASAAAVSVACFAVSAVLVLRAVAERMYQAHRVLPPTRRQLEEEPSDSNPLFRWLPALRGRLAWRALGVYPTPVQPWSFKLGGEGGGRGAGEAHFWVKREDLASPVYGGNKVRTLQYTIAGFESCLASQRLCAAPDAQAGAARLPRLWALGSTGSNQVVATKVFADKVGIPPECVQAVLPFADEPEMDNTLNFMSALSLPGGLFPWKRGALQLLCAIWQGGIPERKRGLDAPWVIPMGGNSRLGVLGQVGGAIELAEQVSRGELPDPDGVVLACGSLCTVTGLVVGVALARALGIPAFRRPGFKIYAQPVSAELQRLNSMLGLFRSETCPLMIGRGIREAAGLIAQHGGPSVAQDALSFMAESLVIGNDFGITGKYGAHSEASREAKESYDRGARGPDGAQGLWMCGHFTAKSFALMLRLLREDADSAGPRRLLLWQTKSAVQPLGEADEWAEFSAQRAQNKGLKKWAVAGDASGHPKFVAGGAKDAGKPLVGPDCYRHLMTRVEAVGAAVRRGA